MDGVIWNVAFLIAGLAMARAAISTARTAQGAVAWVLMLIAFPLLAIPAFLVFGGVSRLQTRGDERHLDDDRDDDVSGRLSDLRAITRTPLRTGNDLRLLVDGEAAFPAIFDAIDSARDEVLIQFYIMRDDALGQEMKSHLVTAAERGCRVLVLCDNVGSLFLGRAYLKSLRAAGIEVRGIAGPSQWSGPIGFNLRNHRKEVVVDGRIAFTGGMNLGQEYVDGGKHFDAWRDTHIRMEGPMAAQLRVLFEADWIAVTGNRLPDMPEPEGRGPHTGLVTGFGPTDSDERGTLLLCALVSMARKRLWVATPYLVPHRDLLTSLRLAQLRGVDLRILIPHPSDNILVWYANRAYARDLIISGAVVKEYTPGFMHQKVILIDDDIASVGTANFDIRSMLLNYEEMALVEDVAFAREVEEMLRADFKRARDVPVPGNWHVRALAPVARLFAPVL